MRSYLNCLTMSIDTSWLRTGLENRDGVKKLIDLSVDEDSSAGITIASKIWKAQAKLEHSNGDIGSIFCIIKGLSPHEEFRQFMEEFHVFEKEINVSTIYTKPLKGIIFQIFKLTYYTIKLSLLRRKNP